MGFPDHLKVAYLPLKYIFEYNNSGNSHIFGGFEGKLFQTLSQALDFKYTLVSPPTLNWGTKDENGNYTGLIGMVLSGEADIAMTYIAVTGERLQVVDFSEWYSYTHKTFFTNFPNELSKAFVNLYPFRMQLWFAILSLLVVLSIVFYFITHRKKPYVVWLLEMFANLLGKSYFSQTSGKMLRGFWGITAFVISMCYTSVLLSMFFIPLREPPIRTFEELSRAVESRGYRFLVNKGSTSLFQLHNAKQLELVEKIKKNKWFFTSSDLQEDALLEEKTAYFTTLLNCHIYYGIPPASLKYISEERIELSPVGVAMRKNFCCKDKLDSVLRNMMEFGITNKYLNDEIFRRRMSIIGKIKDKDGGPIPLSLEHVFGAFVTLGIGYGVSTIVLIIERVVKSYKSPLK